MFITIAASCIFGFFVLGTSVVLVGAGTIVERVVKELNEHTDIV